MIFTQDVAGERAWLLSKFPGYDTMETKSSGLWPRDLPMNLGRDLLWESPPESTVNDFDRCDCEKLLSLYLLNHLDYVDPRWVHANGIVSDKFYGSTDRSNWSLVLTMQRCGTVLLEDILYNTLNYRRISFSTPWSHHFLGDKDVDHMVDSAMEKTKPDVFVCYRNDWWQWALSRILGRAVRNETALGKEPHSTDTLDWNTLAPRVLEHKDFQIQLNETAACWNSICHLRQKFSDLNFYILEYQDIIQFEQLSPQRKIDYDKSDLISNYDQAKDLFEKEFLPVFELYQRNALSCLTQMNCKQNNILKSLLT